MSPVPARHGDTLIFPASLDPDAVTVVRRLNEAGFEAYLVGGCVRDLLLGLIPKDFDVSTAARPRQIRRVFRNSRIIGRRFKLAHIHFGSKVIEVATFRRMPEGLGEPGSPSRDLLITQDNEFGNAEEDVVRRDFTINALLYDVQTAEVIDYVGGVDDLAQRTLRTIGNPATRFAEDPVRMLRAVKFLARLELQPDPALAEAMAAQPDLILRSSPARVAEEIYKLMSCGRADRALPMLVRSGLLERLLPEIAPYWCSHVDELARMGAALDRLDKGRRVAPNHLLLSLLFCGPTDARNSPDADGPPGETLAALTELSGPMAQRMSIPRRDITLMRQLILAQRRLASPRRGRRMRDFLERPSTAEAIDFLYLRTLAGCADPELHAGWVLQLAEAGLAGPARRLRHAAPGAGLDAPLDSFDESEEGPGRRRRRRTRGGRRRRGRQQSSRGDGETRPFGPVQEGGSEHRAHAAADHDFEGDPERAADDGTSQSAAPGSAHDGEDREGGARRGRRRGRGGRRRGARTHDEGAATAAEGTAPAVDRPAEGAAAADPTSDGQGSRPAAERDSRSPRGARKRRRRGGAGRGGAATPGERSSQPQENARQPAKRRQRSEPARPAPPGKGEEGWSPRRNPEDIEDVFDW